MSWVELTKDAISEVMETMFFNVVEFTGEENRDIKEEATSFIELESSDIKLLLVIRLDKEFAKQMTADFLGLISEEVEESDMEDCMKEFANMLAGSVISKSGTRFSLGLPSYGNPKSKQDEYHCSEVPLFVFGSRIGTLSVCEKTT